MTTTAALIAEARALDAEATAGPWETRTYKLEPSDAGRANGFTGSEPIFAKEQVEVVTSWEHGQAQAKLPIPSLARGPFTIPDVFPHYWQEGDAAFIARSRTLLPQLADALEVGHDLCDAAVDGFKQLAEFRLVEQIRLTKELGEAEARLAKVRERAIKPASHKWQTCLLCGSEWRLKGGDETHEADCPARPMEAGT